MSPPRTPGDWENAAVQARVKLFAANQRIAELEATMRELAAAAGVMAQESLQREAAAQAVLADANQRIAELEDALNRSLAELVDWSPRPSHPGPCGPEAGCDMNCVDAAGFAERYAKLRAVLTRKTP